MRHGIFVIVGIILLAIVAFAVMEKETIHAALADLKLVPLEESVTELYFNDSDTLPQSSAAPMSFSFTIRNLEGRDMVYPYVVSVRTANGTSVVLDTNTIPIGKGGAEKISESFRAPRGARAIVVAMPEQQQHISFLLQ